VRALWLGHEAWPTLATLALPTGFGTVRSLERARVLKTTVTVTRMNDNE